MGEHFVPVLPISPSCILAISRCEYHSKKTRDMTFFDHNVASLNLPELDEPLFSPDTLMSLKTNSVPNIEQNSSCNSRAEFTPLENLMKNSGFSNNLSYSEINPLFSGAVQDAGVDTAQLAANCSETLHAIQGLDLMTANTNPTGLLLSSYTSGLDPFVLHPAMQVPSQLEYPEGPQNPYLMHSTLQNKAHTAPVSEVVDEKSSMSQQRSEISELKTETSTDTSYSEATDLSTEFTNKKVNAKGDKEQCPICFVWLKKGTNMKRHYWNAHKDKPKFFCDYEGCTAHFSKQRPYTMHRTQYHGERSSQLVKRSVMYKCRFCDHKSNQKSNIKRHERSKHGTEPGKFFCKCRRYCNHPEPFQTKANMEMHENGFEERLRKKGSIGRPLKRARRVKKEIDGEIVHRMEHSDEDLEYSRPRRQRITRSLPSEDSTDTQSSRGYDGLEYVNARENRQQQHLEKVRNGLDQEQLALVMSTCS